MILGFSYQWNSVKKLVRHFEKFQFQSIVKFFIPWINLLFILIQVSINLLRVSFIIVFEPPAGIKASMQRSYAQIVSADRTERNPIIARARLHFLIAFLHAIILERKRYTLIGWSKHYEFSDADQQCAMEVVDQWINLGVSSSGQSTSETLPATLDLERVPFAAIRALLNNTVYGGRLDNDVDIKYESLL